MKLETTGHAFAIKVDSGGGGWWCEQKQRDDSMECTGKFYFGMSCNLSCEHQLGQVVQQPFSHWPGVGLHIR